MHGVSYRKLLIPMNASCNINRDFSGNSKEKADESKIPKKLLYKGKSLLMPAYDYA